MAEPDFRLPAFEPPDPRARRPRLWAAALGSSAFVALVGLLAALYVGTLGYEVRRSQMHENRLKRILVQTPTVYQVTEGLKEKAPLLRVVGSRGDLEDAVRRWGGDKADEILEKSRSWPQLRIYAAGDMTYFIYFDAGDVMKDYVYVTTEEES